MLFYDLFDLASFKLRSVDAARGEAGGQAEQAEQGDEVAEWEAVEAEVQRLEAALGPQEGFFRCAGTGCVPLHPRKTIPRAHWLCACPQVGCLATVGIPGAAAPRSGHSHS